MKTAEELQAELDQIQEELIKKEDLLAETRKEAAERRVKLKDFEGVDLEEYRALKTEAEKNKQKELETTGNFEAAKQAIIDSYESKLKEKEQKVSTLESKFKSVVVNDALIASAAKQNAMNPEQVAVLLKDNIRLNEDGGVEVVDGSGKVKFNEKGDAVSVSEYVSEFLTENKFMVRGAESGSGSTGGEHKADANVPRSPLEKITAGFRKNS